MDDTMKHTTKDSVFTMLFREPENVMDLYRTIHPEDDTITQEELQTITLETALVESVYNDLGLQARNTLIILIEAQSRFTKNIDYRMLLYLVETLERYVKAHKMSRYSTKSIELPRPELFVVYTGNANVPPVIRLSDHFADRLDDAAAEAERQKTLRGKYGWIEVEVPVICKTGKGDVLDQYIRFCKISDEMRGKYGGTIEAVRETVRKCLAEGTLAKFLSSRQMEVEMNMQKLFDAEEALQTREYEVREEGREAGLAEGRAEGREEGLAEGREAGLAEGREEGREAGLAEGREAGLAEGREAGLAEGREEGREAGLAEGREKGRAEGEQSGIEKGIHALVATLKKLSQTKDTAVQMVMEQFSLQPQIAADKVSRYWG